MDVLSWVHKCTLHCMWVRTCAAHAATRAWVPVCERACTCICGAYVCCACGHAHARVCMRVRVCMRMCESVHLPAYMVHAQAVGVLFIRACIHALLPCGRIFGGTHVPSRPVLYSTAILTAEGHKLHCFTLQYSLPFVVGLACFCRLGALVYLMMVPGDFAVRLDDSSVL